MSMIFVLVRRKNIIKRLSYLYKPTMVNHRGVNKSNQDRALVGSAWLENGQSLARPELEKFEYELGLARGLT